MKFKMKYELDNGEKGCVDLKATDPEAANEEAERLMSERPEVRGYTVIEAKERTSLRHKNIVTKKNVKPNNNQNKENKKMKKTKMTPEEAKEARRQSAKRCYEKKRAAKMAMNGGVVPSRGRPKKNTDTAAAKKTAAPRKTVKHAMCDKACKACTCGKAKPTPEQKHLAKLEKILVKSESKYAAIKEKLAAQKAEIDKIRAEIKEAKALVKACKDANKAVNSDHRKQRGRTAPSAEPLP